MESRKDVVGLTKQLQQAVSSLEEETVSTLLAEGALPSLLVNNTTALHLAVRKPSNQADEKKALAILGLLLDKGDIRQAVIYRYQKSDGKIISVPRTVMNLAGHNSFWQAVLRIAIAKESPAEDIGYDIGQYGSALLDAVRYCNDEDLLQNLVYTLLERGAKADLHNQQDGFTALHWAVQKGKPFVLRVLLAKFPEAYLQKSVATELHGKARTPARMAYKLLVESEEKSKKSALSKDEDAIQRQRWQCICAIAEVAYLPVINGDVIKFPEQLIKEKDIIRRYVFSLPMQKRWHAILDGQNVSHPLGQLNQTQRILGMGDTTTIGLYKEKETEMRAQGYPGVLHPPVIPPRPSLPPSELRTSPQFFQTAPRSAPRFIKDYVGESSTREDKKSLDASSPLFHFSPPPSTSSHLNELERLFGTSHTQDTDSSMLSNPSRFGAH